MIGLPLALVSGEASLPSLWASAFSLCPQVVFPLCMYKEKGISGVSSSYKKTSPVGLRPTLNDPI